MAEYLRDTEDGFEAHFLGSARGLEAQVIPKTGFPLHCIPGSGFRRLGVVGRIKALLALCLGVWGALRVVHRFRPDVVVATGGWASLAGGIAAVLMRRPLLVQEQNSIPGFSNRLLGRWATQVHVAFPGSEAAFAHPQRVTVTGNPLRQSLLQATQSTASTSSPPRVLVVGGSRGARSINRAVAAAIPLLEESGVRPQWLWQTGEADYADLAPRWAEHPEITIQAFLDDIAAAYQQSSLLVCRAGAMTLSEITALAKPAILVPFPGAVDDHQTRNAEVLTKAGAAVLIADADLTGERLATEIARLLGEPQTLQEMSQRARQLARPQATEHLAAAIRGLGKANNHSVAYAAS